MSIARQVFHELRPFFRMFEEPLTRSSIYRSSGGLSRSVFDDAFFQLPRPAVDVKEEGNKYILEAELPGFRKENVQVRIGDSGKSVIIEGRKVDRKANGTLKSVDAPDSHVVDATTEDPSLTRNDHAPIQPSSEGSFTGASTFARTIWLPHEVDSNNVTAKLVDGILTISMKKAEGLMSVSVPVE